MDLNNCKKNYSNDFELGEFIRINYDNIKGLGTKNKTYLKLYPNNFELGHFFRHEFIKK